MLPPTLPRRGNAAVVVALTLTVMLAMAAFALDLGYRRIVDAELQAAVDAAAAAGAVGLSTSTAESTATWVAGQNTAGGEAVVPTSVVVGTWDTTSRTFTADPDGDAVYVEASRFDVPQFFAPILGYSNPPLTRSAIATQASAAGTNCGIFATTLLTVTGNPTVDGSICSNGDVEVTGSPIVDGDARCGPGQTTYVLGHAQVTGSTDCMEEPLPWDTVDFGTVRTVNDNAAISCPARDPRCNSGGNLQLASHDELVLPAGTYWFKTMEVTGQARIRTTGAVNLYVQDYAHFGGGGIVNVGGNPADLNIFSNGTSVQMRGTSAFYGNVVAPLAQVELSGTADYTGLLEGANVIVSGNFTFTIVGSLGEVVAHRGHVALVY